VKLLFLLAIAIAPALFAADPLFERAWNKLDVIGSGRARPGSVIEFTPAEWNAWAQVRVPQLVEGVRTPHIELGTNTATGSALVDCLKMRQSEGIATNPVLARLIDGERPVKVLVRVDSGGGRCTIHLMRAEISGIAATGRVLDLLVSTFFQPLFPEAKIDQPFELSDNLDRIDIRPAGVRVIIKK
jgi:hypothetical protein